MTEKDTEVKFQMPVRKLEYRDVSKRAGVKLQMSVKKTKVKFQMPVRELEYRNVSKILE